MPTLNCSFYSEIFNLKDLKNLFLIWTKCEGPILLSQRLAKNYQNKLKYQENYFF